MLDGVVDGTPPLPPERRERWIEVCTAEFEAIRAGTSNGLLRPYAGTDPGEFFAVAAEVFLTRPLRFAERSPDLYAVLVDYLGQDPAARRPFRPPGSAGCGRL